MGLLSIVPLIFVLPSQYENTNSESGENSESSVTAEILNVRPKMGMLSFHLPG